MNAEQDAGVYFAAMQDDFPVQRNAEVDLRNRWARTWRKVALILLIGAVTFPLFSRLLPPRIRQMFPKVTVRFGPSAQPPVRPMVRAQLNSLSVALASYRTKAGSYPTQAQGLRALVTRPTIPPLPASWTSIIATLPNDAWGRPFVYRCPSIHPNMAYDLLSLGPDRVPSADDIEISVP